ncbi:Fic family protein [archaeon]|jgi:Fic family protein|nr:Fic family protein [archaeon]
MRTIWTPLGDHILLEDFREASDSFQGLFLSRFIYESNLIEGIDINPIATHNEGEEIQPAAEITGHYRALEYVLENYENKSPEVQDIKNIHQLLMSKIWERDIAYTAKTDRLSMKSTDQLKKKYVAGEYRKCKIWVGKNGGTYYRQIPRLMRSLEHKMNNMPESTSENVWNMHHEFETIHPFMDGNGRTGRLLLNWLSLKHFNKFMIIEGRKRGEYYGKIRQYTDKFKTENPRVGFYKDRQ